MTWKTATLLVLAGCFAACSSEGGSRGSGISTLIRGNVSSVQAAAERPDLAGIQVTIAGTTTHGETDASGTFSVDGDFEGTFDLVFERAADSLMAQMQVTVPSGGTLTLNNISIAQAMATAASQQADFDAVITAIDCSTPAMTMRSVQQGDPDHYAMNLATSALQDGRGATLTCADLRVGQEVAVHQAAAAADGTFSGGRVQVVD